VSEALCFGSAHESDQSIAENVHRANLVLATCHPSVTRQRRRSPDSDLLFRPHSG